MAEKNNGREIAFVETYEEEIKNAIKQYNKELKTTKEQLTHMVPYRALAGRRAYLKARRSFPFILIVIRKTRQKPPWKIRI